MCFAILNHISLTYLELVRTTLLLRCINVDTSNQEDGVVMLFLLLNLGELFLKYSNTFMIQLFCNLHQWRFFCEDFFLVEVTRNVREFSFIGRNTACFEVVEYSMSCPTGFSNSRDACTVQGAESSFFINTDVRSVYHDTKTLIRDVMVPRTNTCQSTDRQSR